MGDQLLYTYLMRKQTTGEVTFGIQDQTGIHLSKITYQDPQYQKILKNSIFKISPGGTGFIIKKFQKPIKIGDEYLIGIGLTAGHCVCDPTTFAANSSGFFIDIGKSNTRAIFLKSFMRRYSSPMISATSGQAFIYPGDLALLAIKGKRLKISQLEIANPDEIQVGIPVIIAGYPSIPKNIYNCCPSLKYSKANDLRELLYSAFHDFIALVYSEGNIVGKSVELIDVDCAGINGMSGSPIYYKNKFFGVYVGGPPISGQYQLFVINQHAREKQYDMVVQELLKLKSEIIDLYEDVAFFDSLVLFIKLAQFTRFSILKLNNDDGGEVPAEEFENTEISFRNAQFFNESVKKYSSFFQAFKEKLHFTGNNLLRPANFMSAFQYFNDRISHNVIEYESYCELRKQILMLVIAEAKKYGNSIENISQDKDFFVAKNMYSDMLMAYLEKREEELLDDFENKYTEACYDMIIKFKDTELLCFNTAISTSHPVFEEIKRDLKMLDSLNGENFSDTSEFLDRVKRLIEV